MLIYGTCKNNHKGTDNHTYSHKDVKDVIYTRCNFYDYNFNTKYDAVVSSLAIHHLVTKEEKLDFYKKIYKSLNSGGVFVNADVVLASTDILQECYMEQWKNFMCKNVTIDEVERKWIPTYYEEDRPSKMTDHLEMLKTAGFKTVDVIWKYYNFAVYMAVK